MLIRVASRTCNPLKGHLAALVDERASFNEFKYLKGTEIFGEGEEAQYVYQLISGAARTYKLLSDGRRQINAFHLPGDMFGFEDGATYRFTADAIIETNVYIVTRASLFNGALHRVAGGKNLVRLVTRNLQHAENHMLLLGRKTSLEKVAAFLLEMDERQVRPDVMMLPMNRRDIADYLGLTLETVSRALSALRDKKMLRFEGQTQRQVMLLDRRRLSKLDA